MAGLTNDSASENKNSLRRALSWAFHSGWRFIQTTKAFKAPMSSCPPCGKRWPSVRLAKSRVRVAQLVHVIHTSFGVVVVLDGYRDAIRSHLSNVVQGGQQDYSTIPSRHVQNQHEVVGVTEGGALHLSIAPRKHRCRNFPPILV